MDTSCPGSQSILPPPPKTKKEMAIHRGAPCCSHAISLSLFLPFHSSQFLYLSPSLLVRSRLFNTQTCRRDSIPKSLSQISQSLNPGSILYSNHCSQCREKPATLKFRNNGENHADERDLNEDGLKRQQVRICYCFPYCNKKNQC